MSTRRSTSVACRWISAGLTTSPLGRISAPTLEGLSTSPLGVTLVHFDPLSGVWHPDGVLTLDDGDLLATVSHFSWWAVAVPTTPAGCAGGTVVDIDGTAIAGADVVARLGELAWSRGVTDAAGAFCVAGPEGAAATVRVRHEDGVQQVRSTVSSQEVCDAGCDGFGELMLASSIPSDVDQDGCFTAGPGVTPDRVDCRDDDSRTHPGAPETCNQHDGAADFRTDSCGAWYALWEQDVWGRFGLCLEQGSGNGFNAFPLFNGFATAQELDYCSSTEEDWDATTCTSTRFFVLFER